MSDAGNFLPKTTTATMVPLLKTLKKLKRLDAGFPITDEQRAELTKALPGCEFR